METLSDILVWAFFGLSWLARESIRYLARKLVVACMDPFSEWFVSQLPVILRRSSYRKFLQLSDETARLKAENADLRSSLSIADATMEQMRNELADLGEQETGAEKKWLN